MHFVELVNDGWTRRYVGPKGILLRRNPEHIRRSVEAIQQRCTRDVEVRFETDLKGLMQ